MVFVDMWSSDTYSGTLHTFDVDARRRVCQPVPGPKRSISVEYVTGL